ncbi:MAG: hypothetical protein KY455_10055 [Euryarchaeota archaeon]|nr:hypothetical protein [Euryarchaeota archaeon]
MAEVEHLAPDPDREVLTGSVEEARRILAFEVEEIDRQYQLTERVLRLGVVVLAGVIAVLGLMPGTSLMSGVVATRSIAAAVLLNVAGVARAAFVLEARGGVGMVAFGPQIHALSDRMEEADWCRSDLDLSLLRSYAVSSNVNQSTLGAIASGRMVSLRLISVGTFVYLLTFAYIFEWGIHHVG